MKSCIAGMVNVIVSELSIEEDGKKSITLVSAMAVFVGKGSHRCRFEGKAS
jgi:hypothetical protein